MKALVATLLVLVTGGCPRRQAASPAEMSGFLDDYALLREGGPNDPALVYRASDANWAAYDKVLLEPVTLWRSGPRSLARSRSGRSERVHGSRRAPAAR